MLGHVFGMWILKKMFRSGKTQEDLSIERCKGTKTARKGHMRNHYVLWNMPGTGHCAHFAASLEFFLLTLLPALTQIFSQVHYWVQWPVPGTFCTAMVFKLCRMHTHMDFAHKGHVDFGQWLGPVDPRRACPLCLVRGL